MTTTKDFEIEQGKTFQHVLRWEAAPYIYKPITGITKAGPAVVTATGHGVPNGWRVAVVSVKGMTQINAKNNPPKITDYTKATVLTANTIELNEVNSSDFKDYVSGGYVQYMTPVDLTNYTARMKIKTKVGGTVLVELTTENGGITIDNANKKISLFIGAVATAALAKGKGVYDLEMVSVGGVVTALLHGKVSITSEVTT